MANYTVYVTVVDKKTGQKVCDWPIAIFNASSESIARSDAKGQAQTKYPDCKINVVRSVKTS